MTLNLNPSEQLTHSTVRIQTTLADGSKSTGTGFFYAFLRKGERHVPAIVTNKHVVAGAVSGQFSLTLKNADGSPQIGQHLALALDNFEARWIPHPSPDVDLCLLLLAPLLAEASSIGKSFFFITLDETLLPTAEDLRDLGALEDIIMIGYPNGIWDAVNNMPILRRGITATHPNFDYEGRREFVIDAACFPGSSGSPVLLYNTGGWVDRQGTTRMGGARIRLLGVLYAGPQHTATGEVKIVTIPTQQRAVAFSTIPNNLGFVIKSSRLLELEAELGRRFPDAT
jgi:hypothetical protein